MFFDVFVKKFTDPADERRNNYIKMTHPLITMPDTDAMNMKCLPDSGLLMAHTAITKPCFFSVAFSLAAVSAHPPKFLDYSRIQFAGSGISNESQALHMTSPAIIQAVNKFAQAFFLADALCAVPHQPFFTSVRQFLFFPNPIKLGDPAFH